MPTPGPNHLPAESAAPTEDWRRATLRDLAAIGLNLAHLAEQAAQRLATEAPALEAAQALPALLAEYTRVARAVRQATALDYKLEHHHQTLHGEVDAAAKARAQTRRTLIRDIENAIALAPEQQRENLLADFYERLDDPFLEEDLIARPFGEVARDIRHDLGIPQPHGHTPPLRSPEAVLALALRAQNPPRAAPPLATGPPS